MALSSLLLMSDARIEHAVVGAAFWLVFLLVRNPRCTGSEMLIMLPWALLGTWVPDWDLFLGIGFHRSPITHSALPVILVGFLMMPYSRYAVAVGFGLGVASHLFGDVVEYGNVQWIPGRFWDRTFLIVNGAGILLWAWSKEVKAPKKKSKRRKQTELLTHETSEPDEDGSVADR